MYGRRESTRRARRLLLAGVVGIAAMGAMPWSVAADESPPPSPETSIEPAATSSPSPAPTASPEPDPAPDPTMTPTTTQAPSPSSTETPEPTSTATPPAPTYSISSINLYRSTAMVRQYTNYWCVPAATQSMVNLIRGTSNRTYLTQKYYYKRIRQNNRYTYRTLGNDPQGWAWGLRYFTGGTAKYAVRAYSNKDSALAYIVSSIARTRDPVGVTVRSGTHAWVVLGYRTSHDPLEPTRKSILGFYVSGPLGTAADKWPYAYLTYTQFKSYFTRYHEWQRSVVWEGKWVVIAQ
jgi:hypothetical protein